MQDTLTITFTSVMAEVSPGACVKLISLLTQEVQCDATCVVMPWLGLSAVTL